MGEVNIKAKLIVYSIHIFFILISIFPRILGLNNQNSNYRVIINSESYINIGYDIQDTITEIKPIEEKRIVDLNLIYGINSSDRLLHKWILQSYEGRTNPIKIEIIDKPDFYSASISENPTLKITKDIISGDVDNYSSTLQVGINENAPGFFDFIITIKASVPEFIGGFGFTKINSANAIINIKLRPSYFPSINVEEPVGNEFNVSPYHETKIPIIIYNLCNAPTIFSLDIIDYPKDWDVFIDEFVILPIGSNKTTYLIVNTDHKFDKFNLQLKINYSYYRDPSYSGKGFTLNFSVINDGSYIGDLVNRTIIIVVVIIVIIVFFIVFWFYKIKPK